MAEVDIWMPIYPGDYLADTMHLSTEEHGAYFLLMMSYWKHGGPLPSDDAKLARMARLSPDQWEAVRETLAEFFTVENGKWAHKRIDAEIQEAKERRQKNTKRAKAAAAARWDAPSNATSNATSTPQAMLEQCPSPSPSPTPSEVIKDGASPEFVFSGNVINLKAEQYEKWRKSYSAIPDLKAELQKADDYYLQNPPKNGKWFFPVSSWLARTNESKNNPINQEGVTDEYLQQALREV